MDDLLDLATLLLGTLLGTLLVVVSLFGANYVMERSACEVLHASTGVATFNTWSTGCMVKYNGQWVSRQVMTDRKQEINLNIKQGEQHE